MKRSKYRNVPTVVDGVRFASKAEAKRWCELKILRDAGQIKHLTRQPRWPIFAGIMKVATYVGDFQYEEGGQLVVEDVKGKQTDTFRIKWKFMQAAYPKVEWRLVSAK